MGQATVWFSLTLTLTRAERAIVQVMDERLDTCLEHAAGTREACDACAGTDRCQLRAGGAVGAEGVEDSG